MNNKLRKLLAIATTAAIILFGGGVYLYYFFFRQINAQLIETIPTDAAFLFQINDNETFLKTVKKIHPCICPLFQLDAYPGCQFFVDQLPGKYNQVVFSGHNNGENFSILFACKINEYAFNQLLIKLQIDVKNCLQFELCKIYTYGTHLKRFVFTYHKGIFLASENVTLLKKAITQLKNPKNLSTLKSFQALYNITEKNKKQNWLILNHERYFSHFHSYMNEELDTTLGSFSSNASWAAYQVRFSELEMFLSGYLSIKDSFEYYYNHLEEKCLYISSLKKNNDPVDTENDPLLKYAESQFPSHNDFKMAIHATHSEYWSYYLSERGMTRFSVSQIRLFAFSFCFKEHAHFKDNACIIPANGLIKF